MALSDDLSRRIGKNTKKGTAITQDLVDAVRGDEYGNLIIQEDNTERIVNAINQALATGLEAVGLAAEGYAKKLCPVDTGRLRNSITHVFDGESSEYIGTNVEYAKYVELNDRAHHTNGQAHFLRDAAKDHADKYRSILQSYLENAEG